ncbi:MAG: hypothetical protein NTZ80_03075 [Patescibacteria group bacterium]|nr:hypothetical protein [Patescibacteria group bacterium]
MEQLLLNLGLSIGANAIWDFLKTVGTISKESLKEKLANFLGVQNEKVKANEIIDFLIKNNYARAEQGNKISILLENINARGNVTGFEGSTSSLAVRDIFQNKPMDIEMKNITAEGDVTGMKLNVDQPVELKQPLNIQGDFGSVSFNPNKNCKIIFGAQIDKKK